MTNAEIAQLYVDLLIMQYQLPKAQEMISALALSVIMDQVPVDVQNAYDIETAVGVQLDVLGKYVGALRTNYTPTGPVTLTDADFRQLIKLQITKNNAGSSLATIQSLLSMAFPAEIFVSDNQNMSLNYVLLESLGSNDLLESIVYGGYLPAPMGVGISATIVPDHDNPFFGFVTYEDPVDPTVSPFNSYEFYQLTYPWLTY